MSVVPGKRVCPRISSAIVQPRLQASIDSSQCLLPQMIQGALQCLVVTFPVLSGFPSSVFSSECASAKCVEMLKSPSFKVPSFIRQILSGLISRCMIPCECRYTTASTNCFTKHLTCSLDSDTSLCLANSMSSIPKSITRQWLSSQPRSNWTICLSSKMLGWLSCCMMVTSGYYSMWVICGELYFFRMCCLSFFMARKFLGFSLPEMGYLLALCLLLLSSFSLAFSVPRERRSPRQTFPKDPSPNLQSLRYWSQKEGQSFLALVIRVFLNLNYKCIDNQASIVNEVDHRRFQWLRIRAKMKELEVTRFMWFLRPRNQSTIEPQFSRFYRQKSTRYLLVPTFLRVVYMLSIIYCQIIASSTPFYLSLEIVQLPCIRADSSQTQQSPTPAQSNTSSNQLNPDALLSSYRQEERQLPVELCIMSALMDGEFFMRLQAHIPNFAILLLWQKYPK